MSEHTKKINWKFVEKYFDSFIFSNFWFDETGNYFFYLKEIENIKKLHLLNLKEGFDLNQGILISEIDFNKRAFLPVKFNPAQQELFFRSDTDNKEDFNVFKLCLKDHQLTQLTHSKYTAFSGFSKSGKFISGDRTNVENGIYTTSIKYCDQNFNSTYELISDKDSMYRFSWGSPVFSFDEKSVLIMIDKENRRQKLNILHLDLISKESYKILPEEAESSSLWPLSINFTAHSFLYASDISGFLNIYCHHFSSQQEIQLTHIQNKNNGISVIKRNHFMTLAIAVPDLSRNITTIHFYDLNETSDQSVENYSVQLEGNIYLASDHLESLWIRFSTITEPACLREYSIENKELTLKNEIQLYAGEKENLVHSDYRYQTYKSFDGLEIPSFLVLPKNEIKAVAITAFYGGYNSYNSQTQIFAELGIATFSPAVRGSWGFGKKWESYLKGDLGGNEILDLIWAARYLEKELKLSPSQIGLEGGSHGGYSVLRGLTMPKNFNNQDSQYAFGFGICWAGFADLVDFYKTSNIPDWLVDVLGPYELNKEKYFDRSPLNHFDELNAPIFILHGTNDSRVSPSSMEGFLNKLKNSSKKYFIHLIEAQGHTSGSKSEKVKQYSDMFDFLDLNQ